MGLPAITALSREELSELLRSLGEPAFRADQILAWVYRRRASSFAEMTDLGRDLRAQLEERLVVRSSSLEAEQVSDDGETVKILLQLGDGRTIESVLIGHVGVGDRRQRQTVCVSTQVGCPVGCAFCATGRDGFARNLTAGEIVEQVLHFAARLAEGGRRDEKMPPVTNVVFMGMGEPLANFDATWKAVRLLNAPAGFGLGARHMTISTSGVVPRIRQLAQESLQVGLAVSLHAANDELRSRLVPLNRRYALDELLAACHAYTQASGRRVTYEYALIDHLNDSVGAARELAHRLRGQLCHVNLIPLNPVEGLPYRPAPPRRVAAFRDELQRLGVPVTVRAERGGGVQAACGQLRRRHAAAQDRARLG